MSDAAKRAVAWEGWRWMAGMRTTDGWRLALLQSDGKWLAVNERTSSASARVDVAGALPDLDDAATLGCLLHLVREAWGEPGLAAVVEDRHGLLWEVRWRCDWPDALNVVEHSEAEALVAALEAAP